MTVLYFLLLIGIMILIHELGHFWAARYFDVKVEAFSFGFGPRLFGFRRGETDYRVSLILFGGYVKMAGEQPGDEGSDDPRGFLAKPRWQRLIIAFAGPFMNLLLAVGLMTGVFMVKYQKVQESDLIPVIGSVTKDSPADKAGIREGDKIVQLNGKLKPTWEDIGEAEVTGVGRDLNLTIDRNGTRINTVVRPAFDDRTGVGNVGWSERGEIQIGAVTSDYPAAKAGLEKGDLIISANGQPIHSTLKFHEIIKGSGGKPVVIDIKRNGQPQTITVQPTYAKLDAGPDRWLIGVGVEQKLNIVTTKLSFPDAVQESLKQNVKGASLIYTFITRIVQRRMSAKSLEGPIRIAQLSGEAAREGASSYIMLMCMVSLNLAIFNLLPIPILDGGVIVMLFIEMLMRRDLSLQVKEAVFKVGFVFIMMLVVFVLYNDISKVL